MASAIKERVRQFWEDTPCGTRDLELEENSPEFFTRLEMERYAREPFIEAFAQFSKRRGKKVLEVGIGAATDFIRFARAGALLHGVDLTRHSIVLAKQRLAVERVMADIMQSDAERLPFGDASFDFVYSWGVIHHTEDTQKAANEIVRVTKRGGEVCVMIYHRYSLVAVQCWLLNALLRVKPWRSLSDVIWHHIESFGTQAFSVREARAMFSDLVDVKITPVVTPYDARLSRSTYLSHKVRALIPARFGWFLVVQGRKS